MNGPDYCSRHRPLPTTNLSPDYEIPRIILGCWQLAQGHGQGCLTKGYEHLRKAVELGFNTFDCADIYSGVEELLGQFISNLRRSNHVQAEQIKVHTKFVPDLSLLPHIKKVDVEEAIDRSLSRLDVERIDLVQFHWWDLSIPGFIECARFLNDLRIAGKIRLIGVTNFGEKEVRQLIAAGIPIVSDQVQYSVLDSRPARTLAPFCEAHGTKLLCYGAAAGGFLSDRYLHQAEPMAPFENRSLTKYSLIINEAGGWTRFQKLLGVLHEVARSHNCDITTVGICYMLTKPAVGAIIAGTRSGDHLGAYLKALEIKLTPEDINRISDSLSTLTPIPGDVYELERDRSGPHGRIMRYELNRIKGPPAVARDRDFAITEEDSTRLPAVIIPDVAAELPDEKWVHGYGNSFLPTTYNNSLFVSGIPVHEELKEYMREIGLLDGSVEFMTVDGEKDLHARLLSQPLALDRIRNHGSKLILPYKYTHNTEVVAERTGKQSLGDPVKVDQLGNKAFLYSIFSPEILPKLYHLSADGTSLLDCDENRLANDIPVIVKPIRSASCVGIVKCSAKEATLRLRCDPALAERVLIQEYIQYEDAFCSLYICDPKSGPQEINFFRQVIRENQTSFSYVANERTPEIRSKTEKHRARIQYELTRHKQYVEGVPVFGVDYLLDRDGRLFVMEINARATSSHITSVSIDKLGLLPSLTKGLHLRSTGVANPNGTLAEMIYSLREHDLLFRPDSDYGAIPINLFEENGVRRLSLILLAPNMFQYQALIKKVGDLLVAP